MTSARTLSQLAAVLSLLLLACGLFLGGAAVAAVAPPLAEQVLGGEAVVFHNFRPIATLRATFLLLKIKDDGRGFNGPKRKSATGDRSGTGLTNMRERVAAMGGICEIESVPKRGTTITVRVPVTELKPTSRPETKKGATS